MDLLPLPKESAAFGRHQLRVGGSKWNCDASVQTGHKGIEVTAGMDEVQELFFPGVFPRGDRFPAE